MLVPKKSEQNAIVFSALTDFPLLEDTIGIVNEIFVAQRLKNRDEHLLTRDRSCSMRRVSTAFRVFWVKEREAHRVRRRSREPEEWVSQFRRTAEFNEQGY